MKFEFSFGLDLTAAQGVDPFFVRIRELLVDAQAEPLNLVGKEVRLGFLEAKVTAGADGMPGWSGSMPASIDLPWA